MTRSNIQQAVIFAGGKGERLRPFTNGTPKPLISVNGKPLVCYLIERLKKYGVREVLILTGYLANKFHFIQEWYNSREFIVKTISTPLDFQTGNRIFDCMDLINDEFMVLYGDNYWPFNLFNLYQNFQNSNCIGQIVAYSNYDNYSSSNIRIGKKNIVEFYDTTRRSKEVDYVDLGFGIYKKEVLGRIDTKLNESFEKQIYPSLIENKQLSAFITKHRYYTLTNIDRMGPLKAVLSDRKFIFLDQNLLINNIKHRTCKDTLNSDFSWIGPLLKIMQYLKRSDYKIFLLCFESRIASGEITQPQLDDLHSRVKESLRLISSDIIEQIYVCPHSAESGCFCNENETGLFLRAQRDYHLDLTKCYYVGNSGAHVKVSLNLGIKSLRVDTINENIVSSILNE
jgi:choline kinase/histidinol phosphatase-like enzyme